MLPLSCGTFYRDAYAYLQTQDQCTGIYWWKTFEYPDITCKHNKSKVNDRKVVST